MATVNYSITKNDDDSLTFTWSGMSETNADGQPLILSKAREKTVHVYGNFGTGGHLKIQGTNEAVGSFSQPVTMEGVSGTNLDFTAADIETIKESPYQLRPAVTAGTGVSVTVKIHIPAGQ